MSLRLAAVVVTLCAASASAFPRGLLNLELKPLTSAARAKPASSGKVGVVVVWASWCDVCERSLPAYFQTVEGFKGVTLLAISGDEELAEAEEAVRTRKYTQPMYWADKDKLKATLGLSGVPTVIVYDGETEALRFAGEGPELRQKLTQTLTRLTTGK